MNKSQAVAAGSPRDLARDILHLFLLSALAFAQPLYNILGRHPQFFLVRPIAIVDLVAFLCTLSFLVPLPLILTHVIVARLAPDRRVLMFRGLAGTLAALILLPPLNRADSLPDFLAVILAVAGGAAFAYVLGRRQIIRTFLTYLSPAILLFPLLFWATTPAFRIAAAGEGSRATAPRIEATAPVVFVVFDEFPVLSLLDEHRAIDRARFPNFAALADDAYWFRDATTVESITATAVPAILTGRLSQGGVAAYAEAPENVFALLARRYELTIFEVATRLAPPGAESASRDEADQTFVQRYTELMADGALVYASMILPPSVRERIPVLGAELMEIFIRADMRGGPTTRVDSANPLAPMLENLRNVTPAAMKEMRETGVFDWRLFQWNEFLKTITPAPRRLYFIHSLFPHIPFRFSHDGNYYSNDMALAGWNPELDSWYDEAGAVHLAYQRHLMQVAYTDRLLGRLVERLKSQGIYDDALVVVTADHGISFRPGRSRRTPDEINHFEIAHVPLFLKIPGQTRGIVDDRPAQTIDIVPSIAAGLGVPLPWPVDGRNLLKADADLPATRAIGNRPFKTKLTDGQEALQRQIELFGTGANDFARPGPHAELSGRAVASLRVTTGPRKDASGNVCRFRLLDALRFDDVPPPGSGHIPVLVRGGLGCRPEQTAYAVAVNGIIRGTGTAFSGYGNQMSVGLMLPPESFRTGKNAVEVYMIEISATGQPALLQIPGP